MGAEFWNIFYILVGAVFLASGLLWLQTSYRKRHQVHFDQVMISGQLKADLCDLIDRGDREGAISLFRRKTLHNRQFCEIYIDELARRYENGQV
ncbi:hypothetical protein [Peptococcus niger]|uniref:Uncharacterized protein n=1 Tax=Peptococcus niger TaxID=2741 RepID=A0A1G6Z0N5_PEPNI|nr:hypothetical protein [Peptococcus niger]SDD95863.1 hypothetical protein SAMN04489866_11135 [Peptococcus niger]